MLEAHEFPPGSCGDSGLGGSTQLCVSDKLPGFVQAGDLRTTL